MGTLITGNILNEMMLLEANFKWISYPLIEFIKLTYAKLSERFRIN